MGFALGFSSTIFAGFSGKSKPTFQWIRYYTVSCFCHLLVEVVEGSMWGAVQNGRFYEKEMEAVAA